MLRVLRGRTTSRSSVTPGRYGEPLLVVCYSMIVAACVLIAGVYGSLTANRRILYIQALPAAAALAAVWLS